MTTHKEALKLALEALEIGWSPKYVNGVDAREKGMKAITAIKEALANHIEDNLEMVEKAGPLFSVAPQRTWVGLTEKEILECRSANHLYFYQAIEAKLKEKNT